ncbi:hypothetical protein TrRE_jg2185 [Triparma retinervis]|uniref:Uncharacterized protein n=1 Tax=Triparma retinervis TaxID=2557542 RepID=A0A9W7CDV7_9STRA|nr:hypothetical protein TrRE_jg2185 [Triparma retinervis]
MGRTKVSDGHTAKMEMTRDFRRKSLNTDGEIFNNGVDRAANARVSIRMLSSVVKENYTGEGEDERAEARTLLAPFSWVHS